MARVTRNAKALVGGLTRWLARYLGWIGTTTFLTLVGALVLMLFKDWTIKSLFTSLMVWPMLALGAFLAIPVAFLPVGRIFVYSALGWAMVYNLVLLIA